MILTCHDCSRQLCFSGRDRHGAAAAFGWSELRGKFFCGVCVLHLANHEGAAVRLHERNLTGNVNGVLPALPPGAPFSTSHPCVSFAGPAVRLAEVK